jgi:hypothetical protein
MQTIKIKSGKILKQIFLPFCFLASASASASSSSSSPQLGFNLNFHSN